MNELNLTEPRLNMDVEDKYLKLNAEINMKATQNINHKFGGEKEKRYKTSHEIDPLLSKILNSEDFDDSLQKSNEKYLNTMRLT